MFSLAELQRRISAYVEGPDSFDAFADWYRHASRGKFGAPKEVLDACMKADAALSVFYFDGRSENLLREELAKAVVPFVAPEPISSVFVYERDPTCGMLVWATAAAVSFVIAPAAATNISPHADRPSVSANPIVVLEIPSGEESTFSSALVAEPA